ncbi:MAG: glutamine synthetase family protein [Myxococcota bacterium]
MTEPRPPGRLDLEELEQCIAHGEIETVVTAFPDLYGRLVGKRITGHFFLEEIAKGGMHACDYLLACDMEMDPTPGYAFASWETGYGDVHAVPDLATLRRAAWLDRTAILLCDVFGEEDGRPVPVAPRQILQRQLARLRERGLHAYMGSELEFFLFDESYASARAKGYGDLVHSQSYIEDYHVLSSSFAEPVIGAIRRDVDASGIPIEFSKGEWGPGQHEINLRYAEAQEMADRHVLYKLAAKEIAAREGKALTFMAKVGTELAGNSLHIHLSLRDEQGAPVFAGDEPVQEGRAARVSPTFRAALGGLLTHARELAFFFAPNVNSYKRYRAGTFAPTTIAYSVDNRTVGFRVCGDGPSVRVECRIPGGDANPYLAYAALLAAALDGIEKGIDPGPAFTGDAYAAADLPHVPSTLAESLQALASGELARSAFGDDVVEHLLHFGRTELEAAEVAVTDFERARFFERV